MGAPAMNSYLARGWLGKEGCSWGIFNVHPCGKDNRGLLGIT